MSATITYSFTPNTDVFVVTDDYTISEGKILQVRALKYLEKTLVGGQQTDVVKYVVGLDDGRSVITVDESVIFSGFEDAKNYITGIL